MKFVKTILSSAIALSALTGVQAMASTFDFSYTTVDSSQPGVTHQITGSFQGQASGNVVTDISDVTMSVDGTSLGSQFAFSYAGQNQFDASGAAVSFDGLQSNFLFADTSDLNQNLTAYFYVIPWSNPGETVGSSTIGSQALVPGLGYVDYYNGQYEAANWSLTAVPEPANAALIGAALLAMGLVSRKRKQQR